MDTPNVGCRIKQIRGYEDYYITEHGDVYSKRLRGREKEPHLHKMTPKNPGRGNKYLNVILCGDDGQKTFSVHRLVAEYFCDGYFEGAVVNHKDGNNRNNRSDNLEWVTQKDNIHHPYKMSGMDQHRNYRLWKLLSPSGEEVGTFVGHHAMERFIREYGIDVSPTSLTKYGRSHGYSIIKEDK